jgi:hypothetical protein
VAIQTHAEQFSRARFMTDFQAAVAAALSEREATL